MTDLFATYETTCRLYLEYHEALATLSETRRTTKALLERSRKTAFEHGMRPIWQAAAASHIAP